MISLPPFLDLEFAEIPYASSQAVVLPVPFERTTSYGKGTGQGPAAILKASQQVEWYDEELLGEPHRCGLVTAPPVQPKVQSIPEALKEIEQAAEPHMANNKFLIVLGGEHSLTLGAVRAARQVYGEIAVVQFDAHADLREEYENNPHSHACVMKRIFDEGIPALGVGIRSLSQPEAELIRRENLPILWGSDLHRAEEIWEKKLRRLPQKVYLTFDMDFFDPALVPATGTPEPGGGTWWQTLRLLRKLFELKDVVAMDVVELAPMEGQPNSDFVAARLVYKALGYRFPPPSS